MSARPSEDLGPQDAEKLEGPVDIPLDRLSFGLSPRFSEVDASHVAVLMENLDQLPPIVVTADDLVVVDGVHRTVAARNSGRHTIPAFRFYGDRQEAFAAAVARNVRHGRPLNARERSAAARRLLDARPGWSDRRLADVCGLSPSTIGSIRRSSENFDHLNSTMGRDGRVRPRDPAANRVRIAAELARDPNQSLRDVAATTGASPATVMDVRKRLAEGVDPVPMKLQKTVDRSAVRENRNNWGRDEAFASKTEGQDFAAWFEATSAHDDDWTRFVSAVPLSRLYEVIDEATARSQSWASFAAALNKRAARS